MTIFADASALIAMIVGEPDADLLADRLAEHRERLCSAMSLWEAATGLRRSYSYDIDAARRIVSGLVERTNLALVPIGEHEYALALEAYARYGKGRHPAALNMGDCFAYACARANNAALLYKGNDFSKTDLA